MNNTFNIFIFSSFMSIFPCIYRHLSTFIYIIQKWYRTFLLIYEQKFLVQKHGTDHGKMYTRTISIFLCIFQHFSLFFFIVERCHIRLTVKRINAILLVVHYLSEIFLYVSIFYMCIDIHCYRYATMSHDFL